MESEENIQNEDSKVRKEDTAEEAEVVFHPEHEGDLSERVYPTIKARYDEFVLELTPKSSQNRKKTRKLEFTKKQRCPGKPRSRNIRSHQRI